VFNHPKVQLRTGQRDNMVRAPAVACESRRDLRSLPLLQKSTPGRGESFARGRKK